MHDQRDPLEHIARELRKPVPVSADFDARVMAAVREMPRYGRIGMWLRINTPRTITFKKPLSWALAAASIAVLAALGAAHVSSDIERVASPIATAMFPSNTKPANQRVQFVLIAPDAKKVSVVGDFNGWDISHAGYQAQHRGGGVWSVTAPVPVGHHRYSFVVDDSVWVADPLAPRVVDNDFGANNSALVVEQQK